MNINPNVEFNKFQHRYKKKLQAVEKENKLKIIANAQKTIRENYLLTKQIDKMISFYRNSMSKPRYSLI